MKKYVLAAAMMVTFVAAYAQATLEDVINKFLVAHGGKEKLLAIKTMQIQSSLSFGQMGMSMSIQTYKEQDKLFRIQTSSPMGGEESFTIINDTAGFSYTPAMRGPMGGGNEEPTLTRYTPAEFESVAFQKDCAGMFGMLVNYAEKGHTATMDSTTTKVNGTECYKVNLKLKTGQTIAYFIAAKNGQVKRVQTLAPVAMEMMGMSSMMRNFGGGNRKNFAERKIDIDYDKYKIFDGYPFPSLQTVGFGQMSFPVEHTKVTINQPIDPKWYRIK